MRVWVVSVVLLAVTLSPMLNSPDDFEELSPFAQSSPLQTTLSSVSGWTTGGEEITLTGSGFSDLAFSNTSYDGLTHQWATSNLDMSSQAGKWNAIGVDSNGHMHVVQIKDGNYEIRHSVNDGNGWVSGKINDCGNTYCWDIHMVIDGNDHIHLAYTTYTNWDETLVYMKYDGTEWNDTVLSNSAHFGPIGIAVDSNNHPHISYAADGADYCGNGLRIASFTGTAWAYDIVEAGDNRGCESAIVIDESDNIYIAYQNRDTSKLMIATDKSGSWDSYLVEQGSSQLYTGYMASMALDQQGQFHIAHFDDKNYDLRYSTGSPSSGWNTEILDSSGHTGHDPSIALDAADQPHIVYHTWTGQNLKYATIDPAISDWKISTIANNADVGEGNSIFIDGNGIMHVAFNDDTADILKYTTKSTGVTGTNEITVKFGQYGSVTGDVLDDETIQLTTPSVATPVTVSVSLMDKDDVEHTTSANFEFIDQNDLDGDGLQNADDDCPNVAGTSNEDLNGCPDDDGDGFSNAGDAFPDDANEWMDSDGDGVGDNADAFPNDATETLDSDGDGVGDNADAFPTNALEQLDSDGDGVGDNSDAFPANPNEWEDLDGNQIPDNSEASKIRITSSSEELRIHPYHIYGNNLSLTVEVITSEGFTMISLQSEPSGLLPNTGGLPYGMSGGDIQTIVLSLQTLMQHAPAEFFSGDYITEIDPWVNFTVHVTGLPHGCEGGAQYWDAVQQSSCPSKVANHRTDYYANFSMMLWNGDDDNDGVPNSWDLFPSDANESKDSDGDGVGDNADAFPNDANETADTDGDGVGDNADQCPGSQAGVTIDENGCVITTDSDGDGVVDAADQCPDENASLLDDNGDGCLDDEDGDGVLDSDDACPFTELEEPVNESGCSDGQLSVLDSDADGVSNLDDLCPDTSANVSVDSTGCEEASSVQDSDSSSFLDSFFSGDSDPVTTTVGIGAILIALFGLLQTNAIAAILPDTFRWVQVLRKNSKLTKEEENELAYLQSLTQAYHANPRELAEELEQLRGDLTARYTNNEIKKQTREKMFTLIDELSMSTPEQLFRIAHNDAYFGLAGSIDSEDRTRLLNEKLAMAEFDAAVPTPHANEPQTPSTTTGPAVDEIGLVKDDGYEWLEWPQGSGGWYYRTAHSRAPWEKWG